MSEETGKNMSRQSEKEQRLAAKLRENLRRRKAQSREMSAESPHNGVPKDDGGS